MTRMFCDRCGADITGVDSSSLQFIADADQNGDGTVSKSWDLCVSCGAAVTTALEEAHRALGELTFLQVVE